MGGGKKTRNKKLVWVNVLVWIFFPIGLFRLLYHAMLSRFRMDIATQTTLLNSVLFFFMLAG